MLIDFAGGDLDGLDGDATGQGQLSADNGAVEALTVERLPATGAWRVTFVVAPRGEATGRSALFPHAVRRGAHGNLGLPMDDLTSRSTRVRPWRGRVRRTLFFGLTLLTALGASALLLDVLAGERAHRHRASSACCCSSGCSPGSPARCGPRSPALPSGSPGTIRRHRLREVAGRALQTRTALAMPVYNEDPRRVAAGLEAIWTSLAARARAGRLRPVHPLRHQRRRHRRRRGGDVAGFVSAHDAAGRVFYRRRLRPQRAQGRQHCRLRAPLGRAATSACSCSMPTAS